MKGNTESIKLSTYIPMVGYVLIALLVRAVVCSPLILLKAAEPGSVLAWLAILCPVLIVALVLPLRFSFAEEAIATMQNGVFSIRQALSLARYKEKLLAGIKHALRVLCWGIPLLLVLAGLYYLLVWMDVFATVRLITTFGKTAASVFSGIGGFFAGLFGGSGVQLDYGFREGIYVMVGIGVVAIMILLWGAWRCSVYRYLWAYRTRNGAGYSVKIKAAMRENRGRQLLTGMYNAFLCLPSLALALLISLTIYSKIMEFIIVLYNEGIMQPIAISTGEWVLLAVGLVLHLLILPVRRSVSANLVHTIQLRKEYQ